MNPMATNLSPPSAAAAAAANDLLARRKRGRPRKDESSFVISKPETDLVGKEVSGVVEGSFAAGYFLNVKVNESNEILRGLAFIPGKVTKITPENDVAPNVKMVQREEKNVQAHDQSIPNNDQPIRDDVTDSARAFSPMQQENNGEKDGVMVEEAATRLVEFFPTPMMVSAQPDLVMLEKETDRQKFPGTDHMVVEKTVSIGENVPEMLHLELGNKNLVKRETNGETSASKSGFIANLFVGQEKKEDEAPTPSVQ